MKKTSTPIALLPRLDELPIALLILAVPLAFWPPARDPFRLTKLMLAGWMGLASLVVLAGRSPILDRDRLVGLLRRPVFLLAAPLTLVATVGYGFTAHALPVRSGLVDLWIGAACLVGWSVGLPAARLRRLLEWLLIPATLLSALAILQFHDLWEPVIFSGAEAGTRLGVTSLLGNSGDLGTFLVLPCLISQAALWERRRPFWLWAACLGINLYGLLASQTLTAVIALGVASMVFWVSVLPRRRMVRLAMAFGVFLCLGLLVVAPLRQRVASKVAALSQGEVNRFFTGRLDGWWAAVWMAEQNPLTGVGHGAYRAVFGEAKLALMDQGVSFFRGQNQTMFANAHNEYLEVAAELGLPGVVALLFALWLLLSGAARIRPGPNSPRPLIWTLLVALGLLASTGFPLRLAAVAYPALLALAWIMRQSWEDQTL